MKRKNLRAAVLITAAGSSRRMRTIAKKEFLTIDGQSVLILSTQPFIETKLFSIYVIVLPKGEIGKGQKLFKDFSKHSKFLYVAGGTTRQKSVYNGLQAIEKENPDIVLIHDGARPWVTASVIRKVYEKTIKTGAVIPVIPSVNAMKIVDSQGIIITNLKREFTLAAQTPQGFKFSEILASHKIASLDNLECIDDAEIYCKYAGNVMTVPGDTANKKITYISDIATAND